MELELKQNFSNNAQISNFIEIRPVGVEVFYMDIRMDRMTDGRTDMTKLIFALTIFRTRRKQHEKNLK